MQLSLLEREGFDPVGLSNLIFHFYGISTQHNFNKCEVSLAIFLQQIETYLNLLGFCQLESIQLDGY